jgi:hypothetical protein
MASITEVRRPWTRTPPGAVANVLFRYWRKHRRLPHLFAPRRYTEKIQWRKLFDLDPLHTTLCDKLAVRDFAASRGQAELLLPLLWSGEDPALVPFDSFQRPYVIKTSHSNATNIFVDEPTAVDRDAVRGTLARWLARNHGVGLNESGHVGVPPRLMVEPLVALPDGRPPVDYKFFVFAGRVELVGVRVNEDHFLHSTLHLRPDWTPTSLKFDTPMYSGPALRPPTDLAAMISAAEAVAAGLDHLRVDFLHDGNRFWFGEVSLYSQSGMVPLTPDSMDDWLGGFWLLSNPGRKALARLGGRTP